jgi:hypothetical protein
LAIIVAEERHNIVAEERHNIVAEERHKMFTHLVTLSRQQLVSDSVNWNRVNSIDVGIGGGHRDEVGEFSSLDCQ